MGTMNGMELLSHITERYPQTGVIIMTAFSSESQRFEVQGRGGLEYLEKPFALEQFIHTVDKVLSKLKSGGFSTKLESVTLIDLVQLYCLNMETGCIQTRSAETEGEIYIVDGRFVHAVVGDIKGKDAITEMLSWEGGACSLERGIPSPGNTIPNLSADQLLLDCLRVIDERNNAEADSGRKSEDISQSLPDRCGISKETSMVIEKAFTIFEDGKTGNLALNEKDTAAAREVVDRLSSNPDLESILILHKSGKPIMAGPDCSEDDQFMLEKALPASLRLTESLGREVPDMAEIFLKDRKICVFRLKFGYLCCSVKEDVELNEVLGFLKTASSTK